MHGHQLYNHEGALPLYLTIWRIVSGRKDKYSCESSAHPFEFGKCLLNNFGKCLLNSFK